MHEATIQKEKTVTLRTSEKGRVYTLAVPGSKSVTNRALLLAAVAQGTSTLSHVLRADDSAWCCDALGRLGVRLEWLDDTCARVYGVDADWPVKDAEVHLGDAGTLARFFPGLLAAAPSGTWRVTASPQLAKRPIAPVLDALRGLGAKISAGDPLYPLTLSGGGFTGGTTRVSGTTSSQFVSGLLLAAPLAAQGATIEIDDGLIQEDYVAMTLRMMESFGVAVEAAPDFMRFAIKPQRYRACEYAIEADASTASYFFALAAATASRVTVTNLKRDCLQPDIGFLAVLEAMGCRVTEDKHGITLHAPEKLRGGQVFDMEKISDTVPTLAAIAPFADGPIGITGVAHIRHHESDRLHALATTLAALGVPCEEREDGLALRPAAPRFAEVSSFNDHRIAMAMAVTGLAGDGVRISNPGCVAKTCPVFFDILEELDRNKAFL